MRMSLAAFSLLSLFVAHDAFAQNANTKVGAVEEADMDQLEQQFMQATRKLYRQNGRGTFDFVCTATAFEREGKKYRFLSAAHCVAEDDKERKIVVVETAHWAIAFTQPNGELFVPAKVVVAGFQHRLDDFLVLEVEYDKNIPLMPLAPNDPHTGEIISNIAAPNNLGRCLFRGLVSEEKVNRSIEVSNDDLDWRGTAIVDVNVAGGSSGSAIVSRRQKGIIAVLIGSHSGHPMAFVIPISRFKKFWADYKAGKYKWYSPDNDDVVIMKKRPKKNKQKIGEIDTADYRITE